MIEEGLSGRAAALRLKVSPATGARWGLAIRRTGQARAAPQGRPIGKGKLDPHRAFFTEVIAQDGDITMPELASALHDATVVRAHPNAIGKFLRKLGYPFVWVNNVSLRPCSTGKLDRIARQILPCLRIIIPKPVIVQPAFLIRPLPLEPDVAGDFVAVDRFAFPDFDLFLVTPQPKLCPPGRPPPVL
ncbi:hypothetical protein [Loktanella agnita]